MIPEKDQMTTTTLAEENVGGSWRTLPTLCLLASETITRPTPKCSCRKCFRFQESFIVGSAGRFALKELETKILEGFAGGSLQFRTKMLHTNMPVELAAQQPLARMKVGRE